MCERSPTNYRLIRYIISLLPFVGQSFAQPFVKAYSNSRTVRYHCHIISCSYIHYNHYIIYLYHSDSYIPYYCRSVLLQTIHSKISCLLRGRMFSRLTSPGTGSRSLQEVDTDLATMRMISLYLCIYTVCGGAKYAHIHSLAKLDLTSAVIRKTGNLLNVIVRRLKRRDGTDPPFLCRASSLPFGVCFLSPHMLFLINIEIQYDSIYDSDWEVQGIW